MNFVHHHFVTNITFSSSLLNPICIFHDNHIIHEQLGAADKISPHYISLASLFIFVEAFQWARARLYHLVRVSPFHTGDTYHDAWSPPASRSVSIVFVFLVWLPVCACGLCMWRQTRIRILERKRSETSFIFSSLWFAVFPAYCSFPEMNQNSEGTKWWL